MTAIRLRPVVFLLWVPGLVAEVLSTNMSLAEALQPASLFWLALGYGIPVLVLRELMVARGLGLSALYVMGLGYGIVNEGLIAKTLLGTHLLPAFEGHLAQGRVHLAWTLFILPWHALHSVVLPVATAQVLFPESARLRLLPPRLLAALASASMGLFGFSFLSDSFGVRGAPAELALLLGGVVGFTLIGSLGPPETSPERPAQLQHLFLGVASFIGLLVQFPLAEARAGAAVTALCVATYVALVSWALLAWRARAIVVGSIGSMSMQFFFGALATLARRPLDLAIAAVLAVAYFTWLTRRMLRPSPQGIENTASSGGRRSD